MTGQRHHRFCNPIGKRQEQCINQCSTIINALYCSDSSCACPILTAASTAEISTCEDCLNSFGYSGYGALITLAYDVCAVCASQCSFILTAAIQSAHCTSLSCTCTILQPGGASALDSCASCVESFDSQEASNLLLYATDWGFSNPAPAQTTLPTASSTGPHSMSSKTSLGTNLSIESPLQMTFLLMLFEVLLYVI